MAELAVLREQLKTKYLKPFVKYLETVEDALKTVYSKFKGAKIDIRTAIEELGKFFTTKDKYVVEYAKILGKLGASLYSLSTHYTVSRFPFTHPEWIKANMLQCIPEFRKFYDYPTTENYLDGLCLQFASCSLRDVPVHDSSLDLDALFEDSFFNDSTDSVFNSIDLNESGTSPAGSKRRHMSEESDSTVEGCGRTSNQELPQCPVSKKRKKQKQK